MLDFLEHLKSKKYNQLLTIKTIKLLSKTNCLLTYLIKNWKKYYFSQNYWENYSTSLLNYNLAFFAHQEQTTLCFSNN